MTRWRRVSWRRMTSGALRPLLCASALKTIVFLGLSGRPVGCGFGLQFTGAERWGVRLAFWKGAGLIRPFQFFKTPEEAMTKLTLFLAQTTAAGQPAPSGLQMLAQMAPLILMFGAMYFFLIAPQRKKQKEHEKMLT